MGELTIRIEGLEPFTAAVTRLAEAIENQKKMIVPIETSIVSPEASTEAVKKAVQEAIDKLDELNKTVEKKAPAKKASAKSQAATVTLDDIRSKFRQLAQKGLKTELKALLTEFGVENVSSLDESVLPEVMQKLEELG